MTSFLRASVSNGQPREQALIRQWWHEVRGGRGRMVWEYYLEGMYVDGIYFPDSECLAIEEPGLKAPTRFPLKGTTIVLCEAKVDLTCELIGQALVYRELATRAGAVVKEVVVFAERGSDTMLEVGRSLGLTPILRPIVGSEN